jgi:hypothetical protein
VLGILFVVNAARVGPRPRDDTPLDLRSHFLLEADSETEAASNVYHMNTLCGGLNTSVHAAEA